jgi:glucose-6-phosphate 1-dehydrogenase
MKRPGNQIIVIFGASGDLTSRKLMPAIFSLEKQNLMPERYAIVGVGRSELNNEEFRMRIEKSLYEHSDEIIGEDKPLNGFMNRLFYYSMNYDRKESYSAFENYLSGLCAEHSIHENIVFYFATPPNAYETIAVNLASTGMAKHQTGFRRFIIEKPFGYDLMSARKLNARLHEFIGEDQIYRIDHYLGKETVQNLMVTRFANGIFEPLWNRNYVHRVEITSAESLGVDNRGGYYDSSGALRDMVQNHILQMVGLIAMEPPSSTDPDAIRNEVLKVFQSFQSIREEDVKDQVIRGQYTESLIRGLNVPGYRQENKVPGDSKTETYMAMKFFIANWRWGGVPFFIRTGKRMPTRVTEVVIHFRQTPHHLFRKISQDFHGNQLILRIQPDEGILLKFDMKEPGAGFNVKYVSMDFHYSDLTNVRMPSAYERLLNDVMLGDSTLFSRDDEVETAWNFLKPVQEAWANDPEIKLYGYPAGTWGPEYADDIFGMKGISWRHPCKNLTESSDYCEL